MARGTSHLFEEIPDFRITVEIPDLPHSCASVRRVVGELRVICAPPATQRDDGLSQEQTLREYKRGRFEPRPAALQARPAAQPERQPVAEQEQERAAQPAAERGQGQEPAVWPVSSGDESTSVGAQASAAAARAPSPGRDAFFVDEAKRLEQLAAFPGAITVGDSATDNTPPPDAQGPWVPSQSQG